MKSAASLRPAVGGLMTALVLLSTYLIKLPIPATGGYVHPGDGVILYAGLLCGPYAALVGGLGAAMADLLGGYALYAAPTLAIKAAMGYLAGRCARRGRHGRNALVFTGAALTTAAGYFAFDAAVFGWTVAVVALPPNLLQGMVGTVIGLVLSWLPLPHGIVFRDVHRN